VKNEIENAKQTAGMSIIDDSSESQLRPEEPKMVESLVKPEEKKVTIVSESSSPPPRLTLKERLGRAIIEKSKHFADNNIVYKKKLTLKERLRRAFAKKFE
jgi:hypothetical protein